MAREWKRRRPLMVWAAASFAMLVFLLLHEQRLSAAFMAVSLVFALVAIVLPNGGARRGKENA